VQKRSRAERITIAFPTDKKLWNEELVLQRYELLWEAGLVEEFFHLHDKEINEQSLLGIIQFIDDKKYPE